jgi:hypothetical protein
MDLCRALSENFMKNPEIEDRSLGSDYANWDEMLRSYAGFMARNPEIYPPLLPYEPGKQADEDKRVGESDSAPWNRREAL